MMQGINILLIDDDENLFIIYEKLLKQKINIPFTFDHINTAEKIEDMILSKKYDIIILDQKLNNGNKGLDFLPMIKKNNIYTYVIINSAYGNENLAIEAIRNGADDYVMGNKENNEEFIKVIKKAIKSTKKLHIIENISESFNKFNTDLEKKSENKVIETKKDIKTFSRSRIS